VDEVEKMTTRIDDDRSRPLVCRVGDDLAGEGGIRPSRLFPRHRKNAGIGRPAYTGGKNQQHAARYTPHDLHLRAWKTPEPDFHNDILNQKRVRETSLSPADAAKSPEIEPLRTVLDVASR
jgi:hypothetical protein